MLPNIKLCEMIMEYKRIEDKYFKICENLSSIVPIMVNKKDKISKKIILKVHFLIT
jgi:hypothetical protein